VGGWVGNALAITGIGWFVATSIAVGLFGGLWLDDLTGQRPIFTMLGVLLGLAVALVGGFRMLQQFLRRFG
jgi:hypothetical protein